MTGSWLPADRQAGGLAPLVLVYGLHAAASLALEVALLKCAGLLFGLDLPATGAVLAVYIGGVAVGSLTADHLPERVGALGAFAAVQLLVGVLALGLPELLALTDRLWLALATGAGSTTVQLSRVACVWLAVGPVALVTGAALPVAARHLEEGRSEDGAPSRRARLGVLYAVGTLASAAGAWAGAVLLIPAVGNFTALRWIGALHLANALLAGLLAGRSGAGRSAAAAVDPGEASRPLPWGLQVVALVLGVSLFVAEIAWLHLLWLSVDPTPYVTGSALAVLILSMAAGATVASALVARGVPARFMVSWSCVGAAVATALSLGLGQRPIAWVQTLWDPGSSFSAYLGVVAGMAVVSFGAAAFAYGAASAALFCAGREACGRAGRAAARIAGLQAVGNGAGALVGSFWLLPWAGLAGALATSLVLLVPGQLLDAPVGFRRDSSRGGLFQRGGFQAGSFRRRAAAVAAAVVTLLVAPIVATGADVTGIERVDGELLFHQEDGTGVTEVVETAEGHRRLISNRLRQEGGDAPEQAFLERLQGYVPLVLHEDPEEVLVIGLGTGISLSPFRAPEVERLVCVEISPGIAEAARWFADANRGILEDPRLTLRISDGRNHLRRETSRYDLVVQELFFPYASGASSLYTLGHYRRVRDRLRPGGIATQWVSLAQMGTADLRTLVATFQEVFPETHLFLAGGYLALIGATEPWVLDVADLARRLDRPTVRDDLGYGPVEAPADLLAMYLLGPEEAAGFAGGAALQTDDRLLIEFRAPRRVGRLNTTGLTVDNLRALTRRLGDPGSRLVAADQRRPAIESALAARRHLHSGIIKRFVGDTEAATRAYLTAHRLHPNQPQARRVALETSVEQGLRALEDRRPQRARRLFESALEIDPDNVEARLNLAVALARAGDDGAAVGRYRSLLEERPGLTSARFNLGLSLYRLGRFAEAAGSFRRVLEEEPAALDARFHLANSVARLGELVRAAELYREVLRAEPGHEPARANLEAVLQASRSSGAVQEDRRGSDP